MAKSARQNDTWSGKLAIVQPTEAKKPLLVRLRQRKNGIIYGTIQNFNAGTVPDEITLYEQEILTVFPTGTPTFGKVYNTFVEPWHHSEKVPHWGNVAFYRNLTETELANFHKGLERTRKRFLKPCKLTHLLPINVEVRNPKGKMVGAYHKGGSNFEHYIECNPASFVTNEAGGGAAMVMRIMTHELTHPIWDIYLPDEIKADWVRAYHSFNALIELKVADLDSIRKDFVDSRSTIGGYRKAIKEEEEQKLSFDAIITWIKKIHHLGSKELNLLLQHDDTLTDYWPHSKIHLSELKIPITPYAGKNATECCCESVSLFATKQELPKSIIKLVKRTIQAAQPK